MATSFSSLPLELQSKIAKLSVPKVTFEFLGHRGASPCRWAQNPMIPLLQVLSRNLPLVRYRVLLEEINARLYSACGFGFVSSNVRKPKEYVAACVVANEFFMRIGPWKVALIQQIYCDLDWGRKETITDGFFNMLGAMLVNPTRNVQDIDFNLDFIADNPPTRSRKKGVRSSQAPCFTLSGFMSFTPNIFVLRAEPRTPRFQTRLREWIQQRRVFGMPFDHLVRLPLELSTEIYRRYLDLPTSHVVCPETLPNPRLDLLRISRQITMDLLPVLYAGCTFEFHATSEYRFRRNENCSVTDQAPWVTRFLDALDPANSKFIRKAILIRKAKIVLFVYSSCESGYVSNYTTSIRAIIDDLVLRCSFQITNLHDTIPVADIPISSVFLDPVSRRRCFQIKLPSARNSQLSVEIRTGWRAEIEGSLEHATQLQVAREVYINSVRGQRIWIDAFGMIFLG
jgi:hypothetical protein